MEHKTYRRWDANFSHIGNTLNLDDDKHFSRVVHHPQPITGNQFPLTPMATCKTRGATLAYHLQHWSGVFATGQNRHSSAFAHALRPSRWLWSKAFAMPHSNVPPIPPHDRSFAASPFQRRPKVVATRPLHLLLAPTKTPQRNSAHFCSQQKPTKKQL